ncbi:hypothetical protein Y032_0029g1837 [Ancylostoma ceylanicum]|nr:hypothetical protein Y032_0029g1837 [Ancylostoma ceylanicum]
MRLIVDNLDLMETDSVKAVADWMMKKIRGRVCPFAARFSIDEEDEVEIDSITVSFLNDLLLTCQKRQVDRVDFEVESEPRTVCWKCYCYSEEELPSRSRKESQTMESACLDGEFEEGFIDFLNKLEQRQERIKESALRLLSPPRTCGFSEQSGIEKSVQTAPISLPAEAFMPELPPPDFSDYQDAQLEVGGVDNFVDALFDFEPKYELPKESGLMKCIATPSFVSSRDLSWSYQDFIGSWERSLKRIATPWSLERAQHKSLSCRETASTIEDLLTLQETALVAQRVQKRWNRMHGDTSLSMTAALSTGVGGVDEEVQATADTEKMEKRKESEEWVATLLKMLEQKPARSRKLLKGFINFSKEHKSSKSSKHRCCESCRKLIASQAKASKLEAQTDEANDVHTASESLATEGNPAPLADNSYVANVYEYMKMKLKEHERTKKCENLAKQEKKREKVKKEKNQDDIRAYMVGRKVREPSHKTSSAQTDIREYCIGKKVKKVVKAEDVEAPAVPPSPEKEKSKSSKTKSSSKQRITGKYLKLTKSPALAVAGESSTTFVGRLSNNAAVYGKTFKVVNLSRKELQISMSGIDCPKHIELLYPATVTSVAAGQTAEIPVTITRSMIGCDRECLHLQMLHKSIPISHTLSFNVDPVKEHYEGPLLSDLYEPHDVLMLTKLRKAVNKPRCLKQETQAVEQAQDTDETIHTVVNMLKDEVDSLCSAVLADANIHEKVQIVQIHISCENAAKEEEMTETNLEDGSLTDSVHTAIEPDASTDTLRGHDCPSAGEDGEDATASDFEIVDVDEGASMSSDQDELDA